MCALTACLLAGRGNLKIVQALATELDVYVTDLIRF